MEFSLLELLVSNSGQPFSRSEILQHVWSYPPDHRIDTRVVDVHISRLRSKLEVDPFGCFWSTGSGWGTFRQSQEGWAELSVAWGSQKLARLGLGTLSGTATRATVSDEVVACTCEPGSQGCEIVFEPEIHVREGQTLRVELEP